MPEVILDSQRHLPDEAATLALGAAIAGCLRPGWIILLRGDLGSGKTTLTRGLLRALGYTDRVKSPTYTLVEQYHLSGLDLCHFDLYRFTQAREWLDAGFDELLDGRNVCIIEWPERIARLMAAARLEIELAHADSGRSVCMRGDAEVLLCIDWH